MSDIVLVLGPVAFSDFEVPESVSFGGAQRLAVHRLPGGGRVIDALGRDDAELTWCGVFAGEDATQRARLLDALRAQGAALPLTWDVFFYSVVIASFHAEYSNGFWIPYRLSCTVLRDEAETAIEAGLSLGVQLATDLSAAVALAAGAGVDVASAQLAMAAPGAATLGTSAYAGAQSAVSGARGAIGGAMDTAGTQLGQAAAMPSGPGALQAATAAAGQLGRLSAARGYVARASVNLANASS